MTMRDILNVLCKRRLIIFGVMAAALVGGFAGLKLIAPTYEATARLLVRIGQEDIYMPVLPSSQFRTPMMAVVREEQLRSETGILSSDKLAREVVEELTPQVLFPGIDVRHPWYTPKGIVQRSADLYRALEDYFFPLSSQRTLGDRAVSRFQRDLRAEAVKNSNIIEVSLRSKSPDAAALGVNALVSRYLDERVRIYRREQSGFFQAQLSELEAQIGRIEGAVETFRSEGRIIDVDKQLTVLMERLEQVREQVDEHGVEIAGTARRIEVLREQLQRVPQTVQLAGAQMANSYAISEISKQLADLRRKEAEIAGRYSASDPRLTALRDEIAVVSEMLADQHRTRDASTQEGINPLHARIRDDLLKSEMALAGLEEARQRWLALEAELQGRLQELNGREAEYKRLVQQLEVLRKTRELYLEKTEETRFTGAQADARIGNVSVVNLAVPNPRPVSPKLWLVIVAVLVAGIIGGVGLAFVSEFFDDSLHSEAEIRRHLKLPVIATVPELG
ncbi:MAG: hypothetical protein H3C33_06025 [Rhodocyclaceae bacterium]|nr:hypothetical protein [Rhodocyclaceae bacterium]